MNRADSKKSWTARQTYDRTWLVSVVEAVMSRTSQVNVRAVHVKVRLEKEGGRSAQGFDFHTGIPHRVSIGPDGFWDCPPNFFRF